MKITHRKMPKRLFGLFWKLEGLELFRTTKNEKMTARRRLRPAGNPAGRRRRFCVLPAVWIGSYACIVPHSLVVLVIAFLPAFEYTCLKIKQGGYPMEERKNLCALIPIELHNQVTEAREQLDQTTSEYITNLITEYYNLKENGGKTDRKSVV